MNRYLIFLVLCLSGCSSQSQGQQPVMVKKETYIINSSSGSVGGINVGMSESELGSLAYRTTRGSIVLEGDEYATVHVELGAKIVLVCLLDDVGDIYQCSTESPAVRDEIGSGVGTSLSELKQRYPAGKLLIGDEDGKYANFVSGSKVIFHLDQSGIDDSCFDAGKRNCEIDGRTKVVKIGIGRYPGL